MSYRPQVESLPHSADPTIWLRRVRELGMSVWLDSGRPYGTRGRFDIITAAPLAVIERSGKDPQNDAFAQLRSAIGERLEASMPVAELPFCGGAIGVFGYDTVVDSRPAGVNSAPAGLESRFPDALFGIYTWAVICDHVRRRTVLLLRPETPAATRAAIRACLTRPDDTLPPERPLELRSDWRVTPDAAGYRRAFGRIRDYIHAGDCYQVNLARHWQAPFEGDPWQAYLALRQRAAAPFSAWLESSHGTVMCLSPERFLQARNGALRTQPIKGTAPRGRDAVADRELAEALLASAKNRAENLMIVDLLRNDLGRSCVPGTIHVDRLFELQQFATVHHLVSSIRGQLRDDLHPLDALRGCFPGGSITGAPKVRAMQVIAELEPFRRSVFCGAIGYVSACGTMDTNIAIRTLLARNGQLHAWAGGGIVADSNCEEELAESGSKIEPLLAVLGSTS